MILYNGATGGLGRYLGPAIGAGALSGHAIAARLEDPAALADELRSLGGEPVTFIHLAARVSVPACEADPDGAFRVNVTLARSAVEVIMRWASDRSVDLKVVYVSTGHVYAAPRGHIRLTEADDVAPRSVYARTKLQAEQELTTLAAGMDVPLLVARVFGLVAPMQASNYVLPSLIERVRQNKLDEIPGLDFVRDYLDARDVCDDLLLLASSPWPEELRVVNVCSGDPTSIRELLGSVLETLRPETAQDLLRNAKASPGRADDVAWLVGDPSRFGTITGSRTQRIPLATTVRDAVASSAG